MLRDMNCEVFKGADATLTRFKPIIYCELYERWCQKFNYHANDVVYLLRGLGYNCYNVRLIWKIATATFD